MGTRVFAIAAFLVLFFVVGPVMAQEAGAEGAPPPKVEKNIFFHIIESAGWIFGPLLILMSIFLVVIVVLLVLDLRMSVAIPPGFVDEFIDTVNKRRFKEAFEMARNDTSFLGRVLTAGMSRLQYGLEDARDAAKNMLESIRSSKEQIEQLHGRDGLARAPRRAGRHGARYDSILHVAGCWRARRNPAALSKGIAEALSITFLGIAVSVPSIFFNAFFRNRIVKVSMDTGHIADDLLTQMYHNSKKAGAPGSTMGATSQPPPPPPTPAARGSMGSWIRENSAHSTDES